MSKRTKPTTHGSKTGRATFCAVVSPGIAQIPCEEEGEEEEEDEDDLDPPLPNERWRLSTANTTARMIGAGRVVPAAS
jgi:hypothetical protein